MQQNAMMLQMSGMNPGAPPNELGMNNAVNNAMNASSQNAGWYTGGFQQANANDNTPNPFLEQPFNVGDGNGINNNTNNNNMNNNHSHNHNNNRQFSNFINGRGSRSMEINNRRR